MEHQDRLLPHRLKNTLEALESALGVGFETPMETARARNLLAYLLCRLGRLTEALQQTGLAGDCEGQQQNLVSLANRAVILWRLGQRDQAGEVVRKLDDLRKSSQFPYLLVKAEAELAYTYTRFGPSLYRLALKLFGKVVQTGQQPEVWVWNFGLALTRRRLLSLDMTTEANRQEDYISVLRLFQDIVQHSDSRSLKAKAYAEMALILYTPPQQEVKEAVKGEAGMTVAQACDKALELDGNNNSVLWKCGKLLRYLRQTERSCELLTRAVSLRPSTKGYHHLGLTYKALATQEGIGKSEEVASSTTDMISRALYPVFQTQLSRCSSIESQCNQSEDLAPKSPLPSTKVDSSISGDILFGGDSSVEGGSSGEGDNASGGGKENVAAAADADHTQEKAAEATAEFRIWKAIKSPLQLATKFTKGDPYLEETIRYLSRAVDISDGENGSAVYDLALVYRAMGELEMAKDCLEKTIHRGTCLAGMNKIRFFEQLGLVMADMSKKCIHQDDEKKKKDLEKASQSHLLMALKAASESCSHSPHVQQNVGALWQSFATLFEAVEKTEGSQAGKLREKAALFRLIRNNKTSLALLQELKQMDPQKANDPEYLKLCIQNYVEMRDYEKAIGFVDLLQCTAQNEATMQLFQDRNYLLVVYLRAAELSLLLNHQSYKFHFSAAFRKVYGSGQPCTSSEDTDTAEEEERAAPPTWDVHIVHEDSELDTVLAEGLASVLKNTCGLAVTRNDEDSASGPVLSAVLKVMKRSRLLVVMAGHKKMSKSLKFFTNHAARRQSSLTLLVHGDHVPAVMKAHRSMSLPDDLLTATDCLDQDQFTQQRVRTVIDVFSFLLNISLDQPETDLHDHKADQ